MRTIVFGATGRMGQLLVRRALDEGHEIVAYARHPDKLQIDDSRLSVLPGELDDDEGIIRAITGADAVIEGVGSQSDGTRRIITAMETVRIRRFVVVSTCSVTDPADGRDLQRTALVRFVKTAAPGAYKEVRAAADAVRASSLDWTLVRVARLTDKPATGDIKVGYYGDGEVGLSITRADMATFLLDQTSDSRYVRQAPAIST
jgi:putative NADH-flavin reductase